MSVYKAEVDGIHYNYDDIAVFAILVAIISLIVVSDIFTIVIVQEEVGFGVVPKAPQLNVCDL